MSILHVDFNNLAFRCLFSPEIKATTDTPNYELWAYMVFQSILGTAEKFGPFDHVNVAIDGDSWRHLIYKRYKEDRAAKKESMGVDFDGFWKRAYELLDDMRACSPFRVMQVKLAEADDTIATICMKLDDRHMVLSADEDYSQLLLWAGVRIYDPLKARFVENAKPGEWLLTRFLMGQKKDNIFNVLTPDDWGLTEETKGKRKPGFGEAAAGKAMTHPGGHEPYMDSKAAQPKGEAYRGWRERYARNQRLIDFRLIPEALQQKILGEWSAAPKTFDREQFRAMCERRMWGQYLSRFDEIANKLAKLN